MTENIAKSNAATNSTTAKQEKYEKKMAKYAANKLRKEQKENERMANRQKNERPISEWRQIEVLLIQKARSFYENGETFTHFPITYNGKLNMISAVHWGRNAEDWQTTAITVDGTNERSKLDALWDRVLDIEMDNYIVSSLTSGRRVRRPRRIIANTPQEAFEIACKENNVKLVYGGAA